MPRYINQINWSDFCQFNNNQQRHGVIENQIKNLNQILTQTKSDVEFFQTLQNIINLQYVDAKILIHNLYHQTILNTYYYHHYDLKMLNVVYQTQLYLYLNITPKKLRPWMEDRIKNNISIKELKNIIENFNSMLFLNNFPALCKNEPPHDGNITLQSKYALNWDAYLTTQKLIELIKSEDRYIQHAPYLRLAKNTSSLKWFLQIKRFQKQANYKLETWYHNLVNVNYNHDYYRIQTIVNPHKKNQIQVF